MSGSESLRQLLEDEVFIHEASHALVYDALEQPMQSVWVRLRTDGKDHGLTERGTDVDLPFFSIVLEFMAGAAATVFIAGRSFESAAKRFVSDFSTVLRVLGDRCASPESKMAVMAQLRLFIDGFGKEWVLKHREPILRFASLLKSSQVSPDHWELRGDALARALSLAWGGSKPSKSETEAGALKGWESLAGVSVEIGSDWQQEYLRELEKPFNSYPQEGSIPV